MTPYALLENDIVLFLVDIASGFGSGDQKILEKLKQDNKKVILVLNKIDKIKSNRESGDGRFDVCLIPREKRYPGIILELKWEAKLSETDLDKRANKALEQIDELRYDAEMKEDGITDILKFGIAFSGKKVSVKTK